MLRSVSNAVDACFFCILKCMEVGPSPITISMQLKNGKIDASSDLFRGQWRVSFFVSSAKWKTEYAGGNM